MENNEIWKIVPEYEGIYQVSNIGRVRSLDRILPYGNDFRKYPGKLLRQHLTKDGYCYVNLNKRKAKVHRLVMAAFQGVSKQDVHHINEVKTDNNLCDLMYMDTAQNTRIATAKLDERSVSLIKQLIREGKSNTEIGKIYGVNHRTISNIRNDHTWTHVA